MIATGSNDKSVRILPFSLDGAEAQEGIEIKPHNGTIRDLTFTAGVRGGGELLITGGGGDCAVGVHDSLTGE